MSSKKIKPLITRLSNKYNLSEKEIEEIINSPYAFTEKTINDLQLKDISEEEFNNLKTNFIYKYLGKIYTTYKMIKYKNTKFNK